MERNMNTVRYLQSINFSQLTLNEKVEIKAKGRHTPFYEKVLVGARIIHASLTPIFIKNVNGFVDVTRKMLCFASHAWCLVGIYHGQRMDLCIKC